MAALVKLSRATLSRALLETSVSLDRLSMAMVGDMSFYEEGPQHRTFVGLLSTGNAVVSETASVNEMATILGGVTLGPTASVGADAIVEGPALIDGIVEEGAVVKANVTIEKNAILGKDAIALPGTVVPAGQYWIGKPAAFEKYL